MRYLSLIAAGAVMLAVSACQTTNDGAAAPSPQAAARPEVALKVAFADSAWTGSVIPAGQQCRACGGSGSTPALTVSDLPEGTANVDVVFWDSHPQSRMTSKGDHGGIRVAASGPSVTLPAVPGETTTLPAGVTMIARHSASHPRLNTGAYLPPCACLAPTPATHGYYAEVRARDANGAILGRTELKIGDYTPK